jgi:hypothetical protein
VEAKCGASKVLISGYGAGRPLDRAAAILVDGHTVQGPKRASLLADLTHRRAAYRVEILCDSPQNVTVRIHVGEKQADGNVRYWSGAAFLKGRTLLSYTGLQESDQESFWFR